MHSSVYKLSKCSFCTLWFVILRTASTNYFSALFELLHFTNLSFSYIPAFKAGSPKNTAIHGCSHRCGILFRTIFWQVGLVLVGLFACFYIHLTVYPAHWPSLDTPRALQLVFALFISLHFYLPLLKTCHHEPFEPIHCIQNHSSATRTAI